MLVQCPNCQTTFEVKRRAQGLGTRPKADMVEKEREMLEIVRRMPPGHYSVREIQKFIFDNAIPRWKPGAKAWNYHYVQEALSKLVGRELLRAERHGRHFVYFLPMTAPEALST